MNRHPTHRGGLAVALLAMLAFTLAACQGGGSSTSSTTVGITPPPGNTNGSPPTATPTAPSTAGWTTVAALASAQAVAFAPGNPLIGYACGTQSPGASTTPPVQFSATSDGGATWSAFAATPATGANCTLRVNPTNAQDIVLTGTQSNPFTNITYRSLNGGKTWAQLSFPGGGNIDTGDPVWIGSTLYVAATSKSNPTNGYTGHELARSVNGGALALLTETTLVAGVPAGFQPYDLFANGTALYVTLIGAGPTVIAGTTNGGATWSHFTAQGLPNLAFVLMAEDGKTLYSFGNGGFVSTDFGHTWKAAPAGADLTNPTTSPDGTVAGVGADGTLWVLHHGATAWKSGLTLLASGTPFIITVSHGSTPAAVWDITTQTNGATTSSGVATHPLP